MQHVTCQPATTIRPFNILSVPDANRPAASFQVPLNLSPDEIRELVRDVLG